MENILRTFDLLDNLKANYPKDDILARRTPNGWVKYSVDQYSENSHSIAYGLLASGYKKGDHAITVCNNCPEWNFIDLGLNLAGMIHIPVYPTLSANDYTHIFEHSDCKIIFVGNNAILKKLSPIIAEMKNPAKVIVIDESIDSNTNTYLKDICTLGRENEDKFKEEVEKIKRETSPDDMATIIYTSGTTGVPKGVMLSHWNMIFNAMGHARKQTVNHTQKMVSFLPLCHVYERSMNYEYQMLGIGIYYAESMATIARDLAECHANGFCAVPRVLEMMYRKLDDAGKKQKGIKRVIYNMAWKFGNNFDNYNKSWWYNKKRNLYDNLVYSKWRANLGGNEMLVVSGGSSIQAKIVRLFNAAKLHIFEGYGMTETSPVIAVNSPVQGFNIIGTVGKPMEGTDFMFAEDGEILTKGPHIMLGYYKDLKATKDIIDEDGWLHTGDIGRWIEGQYVQITDRKKEIFKLSSGKYVAPQVIETMLKESSFVENAIVVGANQKFASAIIVPNIDALAKSLGNKSKIDSSNPEEFIKNPAVIAKIHQEVELVNHKLAAHEQIKRERIVADEWSTANELLSQTLKLKRANIHKRYEDLIKDIFSADHT